MKLITTREAADLIGVTTEHIRDLIKRGRLAAHLVKREWDIELESAIAYRDSPRQRGTPKRVR